MSTTIAIPKTGYDYDYEDECHDVIAPKESKKQELSSKEALDDHDSYDKIQKRQKKE